MKQIGGVLLFQPQRKRRGTKYGLKKIFFAALLALGSCAILFSIAFASGGGVNTNYCFPIQQPNSCLGVGEALGAVLDGFALGVSIGILKGLAQVAWLLDRGAAFVFSRSVINAWILNIRDDAAIRGDYAGLLRDVMLGNNGHHVHGGRAGGRA